MHSGTDRAAPLRQQEIRRGPRHGWLGIPAAAAAVVANLPLLFARRRPGTPLRVLAVMAIAAALRSRGGRLRPDRRQAVIEAMELGALLNDRFDGDITDPGGLGRQMLWFKESAHRKLVWSYAKRLRHYERSRPRFGAAAAVVKLYREGVNRISLALLWVLASDRNLADAELEIRQSDDLRHLFHLVMLAQLIDDVWDVRLDRSRELPSFATAADASGARLRGLAAEYANAIPLRFDHNFCLRLALAAAGSCARGVIAINACRSDRCRS